MSGSAHAEIIGGTLEVTVTVSNNCSSNTPTQVLFPSYDQVSGNTQALQFSLTCVTPVASADVRVTTLATIDADTFYLSGPGFALHFEMRNTGTGSLFRDGQNEAMDISNPNAPVLDATVEILPGQVPPTGNYTETVTVLYEYN